MIIKLIKKRSLWPEGSIYMGLPYIPAQYAAKHGDIIAVGNTRIGAIKNCMERMLKP